YAQMLFFQPFLVGDRLLLHVFDIERPTEAIVLVEDMCRRLAAQHAPQQRGQLHGVVNAEVEAEPAERIVHMGAIAREKDAALAERRRNALVHVVEVAMDDGVAAELREKFLQGSLDRVRPEWGTARPKDG